MKTHTLMATVAILTLLIGAGASAEITEMRKPVICMNTVVLLSTLAEQGQELPVWLGQGDGEDKSRTTLLINAKTGTWSIVQFDGMQACVLGSGVASQQIFTGPKI